MEGQRGFSLIELLVVVAIILIVAAIGLPALMQARKSANESAAVATLRSLADAEFTYSARNGQRFGSMADLAASSCVDNRFGTSGTIINGYTYTENYAVVGFSGAATSPPGGFGFYAAHQGSFGDSDYELGPDGTIRYGASGGPSGQPEGTPTGK